MKRRFTRAARLAGVIGLSALASQAIAQTAPTPTPPRNPPSVYDDYHPSLSDLMTAQVQPRHIKLGLALRSGNWTYMAYEAGELRGSFNRIVRSMPSYEGKPSAQFMSMITPQLDAMVAAVRAKNMKATTAAYADLTATCNQCHESQGRTYIVIRAPTTAMYPDQDFAPKP